MLTIVIPPPYANEKGALVVIMGGQLAAQFHKSSGEVISVYLNDERHWCKHFGNIAEMILQNRYPMFELW